MGAGGVKWISSGLDETSINVPLPCQRRGGAVIKTCFLKYRILYEPFEMLNRKEKKKVNDVNLNSERSEQLLGAVAGRH